MHTNAMFERAQTRFNACFPALATPKLALFLSRSRLANNEGGETHREGMAGTERLKPPVMFVPIEERFHKE